MMSTALKVRHPELTYFLADGDDGFPLFIFDRDSKRRPFTQRNCASMRKAVLKAFPNSQITKEYNGADSYTFSVAIRPRRKGQ